MPILQKANVRGFNTMLVLFIGDGHISGRNPVARKDNYVETQFLKFSEIVSIANEYDAVPIIVGDLLDKAIISNTLINRLGQILLGLKHPLYFVWGNHDLLYHSMSMWNRTSLGVLLSNNPMVKHISEFENDYGVAWDWQDWDCDIVSNGSKFLLSHKAVVNNNLISSNSVLSKDVTFSTQVTDPSLRQYDLIVCGHWHKHFTFRYKNTKVLNPGPVMRQTVIDILMPSVTLMNLDTLFGKQIRISVCKNPEDVLSTSHLDSKVEIVRSIEEFTLSMLGKDLKKATSFIDNLIDVLDSGVLNKDVEELLRDIISEALEDLDKAS